MNSSNKFEKKKLNIGSFELKNHLTHPFKILQIFNNRYEKFRANNQNEDESAVFLFHQRNHILPVSVLYGVFFFFFSSFHMIFICLFDGTQETKFSIHPKTQYTKLSKLTF